MGSRFPGRPETSNKRTIVGVRLDGHQRKTLEEFGELYHLSLSEIIREAISVWLNLNSKGAK